MLYLLLSVLLLVIIMLLLWPARKHQVFCVMVGVLFFGLGSTLYLIAGAPEILPLMQARDERITLLKASLLRHSEMVKADPKDLAGWVGLGQDFIESGQWDAAANAFKQAVILSQGNPKLILAYAKTMIFKDGGMVSHEAKKSLEMVLIQEPTNAEAQYYLALWQLQEGNNEKAMQLMKKLYHSLPDDAPLKALIDQKIGRR